MTHVALSLGANQGNRVSTLRKAIEALLDSHVLTEIRTSSLYETDPVGGPQQDLYLNMVVTGATSLEPHNLLRAIANIEQQYGRVRDVRWGPRTLDIDILCYGTLVLNEPDLQIPHPRAHERGFVLVPWAEVDEEGFLAQYGTVRECLSKVATDGVRLFSTFTMNAKE